jgi:hypothetical protein
MMTTILLRRAKAPIARQLIKHPVKGTRALLRARRVRNLIKGPAGVVALSALVAVPVGLAALKRVRAH